MQWRLRRISSHKGVPFRRRTRRSARRCAIALDKDASWTGCRSKSCGSLLLSSMRIFTSDHARGDARLPRRDRGDRGRARVAQALSSGAAHRRTAARAREGRRSRRAPCACVRRGFRMRRTSTGWSTASRGDGTLLRRAFAEMCENVRDFTVAESAGRRVPRMRRTAPLRAAPRRGAFDRGESGGTEPGRRRNCCTRCSKKRSTMASAAYACSPAFPSSLSVWLPRCRRSCRAAGQDLQGLPELPSPLSLRRSSDGAWRTARHVDPGTQIRRRTTCAAHRLSGSVAVRGSGCVQHRRRLKAGLVRQ